MKPYPPADENVEDIEYWKKWFKILTDQNLELLKKNKELKKENEHLRKSYETIMNDANFYKMAKNDL